MNFELTRSNIIVKDVPFWEVNNDGVGYIRIKKFSKNTAKDFRLGLKEILKNPNTKGLVVDLRGNTLKRDKARAYEHEDEEEEEEEEEVG